jgi:excisionase family DNA binding protein/PAS domain S-box-containing protein
MEKVFFSTPELAELLGVFHTTVRRWIEQDQIRGFRVGRNYKIPATEVIRMLDEHGLPLPERLAGYGKEASRSAYNLGKEIAASGSILQRLLIVDDIEHPALICRQHTILGSNKALAEMMGSTQTDVIGSRMEDLMGKAGYETIAALAKKCTQYPEKGSVESTVVLNGQGNKKRKTRVSVSPLADMKDVFLVVLQLL